MTTTTVKVLAYVVRGDDLLVFRHADFPTAGLQVPAGTVEPGEPPVEAVLREVREESGMAAVEVTASTLPRPWRQTGVIMRPIPVTTVPPLPSITSG